MRVAVIGCGSIGARHATNALRQGHDVVAFDVVLTRPLADPRWDGATIAATWGAFIRAQPAAVLICTPAATHAAVARDLLDAGYHGPLLVEKPLATTLDDSAVFRTWPHPTTQVGYMLRFHPDARVLLEARDAIQTIACDLACDMRTWPGQDYSSLLLECSHELDLALACGAPPVVTGAILDEWTAAIQLGSAGSVRIDGRADRYRRSWTGVSTRLTYHWTFNTPAELGEEMYITELDHFLSAAAQGRPTAVPFADGLRVLDVIEQAQRLSA